MHKLRQEIRSHFPSYSDINSTKAFQLPYLQAVISEGLRIYPPSPQGLPRVSPGAVVDDVWIPAGVSGVISLSARFILCTETDDMVFIRRFRRRFTRVSGRCITTLQTLTDHTISCQSDGLIRRARTSKRQVSHFQWDRGVA